MNAKPFKFMTRHIFPVILAVFLICFTPLCSYMEAYATDLPLSGGWSGYDIIYTLLNSIGITISVQPDSDGTPPGYTAESYDAYMAEVEAALLQAQDNIDTGDTPVQQLIDELKALPSTIKDGCISVSKDLWEFLNTYVYDSIVSNPNVSSDFVVDGNYTGAFINALCKFSPFEDSYTFSGQYYVIGTIEEDNLGTMYFACFNDYDSFYKDGNYLFPYNSLTGEYNGRAIANCWSKSGMFGHYMYVWDYDFTILSTNMTYVNKGTWEEVADSNVDVIWPVTDFAYDIVNHVATWDEAIAAGAIITAEDDDTVAVISLTDTAVGEDVYVDAGDIVIPGSSEAESEVSSEATSEAESEKADELVDESVISTLPDKAAAAGDITKLFPFCIPFDIVNLVKGMQASKKAPVWTFKYYFKDIDYTFEFTVDMTDYDKYIQIFRAGIVIFYVITLMLLTIRYSSGIVKD